MDSCNHKPQFKWKTMLSRKPQYTCRKCGKPIDMNTKFRTGNRVINGVLVAVLLLLALNTGTGSSAGTPNWTQMAIEMGTMLGIVALYLLVQVLLTTFAPYELTPPPEMKTSLDEKSAEPIAESPRYSQEQREIMEMYAAIERQALIDAGQNPDTVNEIGKEKIEIIEEPVVDICVHVPMKTWKNYIPAKFDFVCEKCGKPITFTPSIKRNVNILLLAVTFLILMPSFINLSVAFWKVGLLALLVLIIGIAIQYFFLKRGPFALKDVNKRKPGAN